MKSNISKYPEPWRRALRRCTQAAALLAAMLMSPSCVNDNSVCIEDQPGYQEGKDVWLTFTIANQGESQSRSRAGAPTDPSHPDEAAVDAENYIDCDDYDLTVMYLNEDGRVMKVFNKDEFVIIPYGGEDVASRQYELKLRIHQDYFYGLDNVENVNFSLLVVANLNGTKDAGHGTFGINWMSTVADLSALNTSFGYTGLNGEEAWTPDIADKRLIPMAGLRKFTVSATALKGATDMSHELNISEGGNEIYMQRSMAKIRVVDNLAENGDTDKAITNVTLTGLNNKGAYLPLVTDAINVDWLTNTSVVHTAHADAGWYSNSELPSYTFQQDGYDAWGFYITEYSSSVKPNGIAEPTLNITVKSTSTGQEATYQYPISRSIGTADMTRNHIYQFVVTEINSEISIDWTVCDMDNPGEVVVPPFS